MVEINTEIRVSFLTWADEIVEATYVDSFTGSSAGAFCVSQLGLDGGSTASVSYNGAANYLGISLTARAEGLSEVNHYWTVLGSVSAGTGTWAGTPGGLTAVVRG